MRSIVAPAPVRRMTRRACSARRSTRSCGRRDVVARENLERNQVPCACNADQQVRQAIQVGSASTTTSRSIPDEANSRSTTGASRIARMGESHRRQSPYSFLLDNSFDAVFASPQ